MPARTDHTSDPTLLADLLLARRGQAYFSRQLHALRDADFAEPSLLPGWSRGAVAAHVGLNARALTRLLHWAATGEETPMYSSNAQRSQEIEFSATLPPQAIVHLSDHAAVHLDVEWRDLPSGAWHREVRTAQGRLVPVSETIWMRMREVWLHAIDLANGGRFNDIPAEVLDRLYDDLFNIWRRRRKNGSFSLALEPTDRDRRQILGDEDADTLTVRGRLADLIAWGTGRSAEGVSTIDGQPAPPAPAWL